MVVPSAQDGDAVSRPIALIALLLCATALTYAAAYRFLWASWPEWPRVDGLPLDRWFWWGEPVPFEVFAQ
jgi:hypothetical protein